MEEKIQMVKDIEGVSILELPFDGACSICGGKINVEKVIMADRISKGEGFPLCELCLTTMLAMPTEFHTQMNLNMRLKLELLPVEKRVEALSKRLAS